MKDKIYFMIIPLNAKCENSVIQWFPTAILTNLGLLRLDVQIEVLHYEKRRT